MLSVVSAFTLAHAEYPEDNSVWGYFVERSVVSAIIGGSDTGKSTLLRELAIHIVLGAKEYLGQKINAIHKRVLIISIEDGQVSVGRAIKRKYAKKYGAENLENLHFVFTVEGSLIEALTTHCAQVEYDLVIIDCYSDVFTGTSGNDQMETKKFLAKFDELAKEHNMGVLFLHHLNKRADEGSISKKDSIGSSAFEQKVRCLFGLTKSSGYLNTKRKLQLLKANLAPSEEKRKIHLLDFNEQELGFSLLEIIDKSNVDVSASHKLREDVTKYAASLIEGGKTYDECVELVNDKFGTSYARSTIHNYVKKYEDISDDEGEDDDEPLYQISS